MHKLSNNVCYIMLQIVQSWQDGWVHGRGCTVLYSVQVSDGPGPDGAEPEARQECQRE